MDKLLHKSTLFTLRERRHRKNKTGAVFYELKLVKNEFPPQYLASEQPVRLTLDLVNFAIYRFEEDVRNVVDPQRNRAGRWGTTWKFRDRVEAEQMLTMLLLRWSQ